MKKIVLFLSLLLGVSPAVAGFTEGEEYLNNQRYAQAFAEFKPLADTGDFRSQYYVGYLYLNGYGVEQDNQKALSYLQQSVAQNYDLAEALMGFLYAEGKVIPQDKKKALELYNKAAERGNISAFLNLGVAYYTGDGVDKDIKKAISYFERIPLKEKPVVGRYLGDIFQYDSGVQDFNKAREYYMEAARGGDLGAYHALGYMNQKGLGGIENMDEAIKFYQYAASQNYAPSQYVLGTIYANGDGVTRNPIKAYAWLSLAVNQKLGVAEEAQKKISENMTLTDLDNARRESIDIQKTIIGKIESPIKQEEVEEEAKKAEVQPIRRRRRRR